jgi:peroxiredoxin family protein
MGSRVSVVVVSGSFERLQMAGMVASISAVSGNDVHVFLSMNALAPFRKGAPSQASPEGEMGKVMAQKKVPPFKQLFESAVQLGDAKIYPCSMAMDVLGYARSDLEPYLSEHMGLTRFLDEAASGQILTF